MGENVWVWVKRTAQKPPDRPTLGEHVVELPVGRPISDPAPDADEDPPVTNEASQEGVQIPLSVLKMSDRQTDEDAALLRSDQQSVMEWTLSKMDWVCRANTPAEVIMRQQVVGWAVDKLEHITENGQERRQQDRRFGLGLAGMRNLLYIALLAIAVLWGVQDLLWPAEAKDGAKEVADEVVKAISIIGSGDDDDSAPPAPSPEPAAPAPQRERAPE